MENFLKHEKSEHGRIFVVNWLLGTICNYRCRYCNDKLYAGQTKWVDIERCEKMVEVVFDQCALLGVTPYFEFTGGEVTLYKPLPRLLEGIKKRGGRTGIITNGSAKFETMDTILPLLDHACISYHPGSAKDDHFVENVARSRKATTCHVNVMADPTLLDRVEAIFERLDAFDDISISIQPLQEKLGGGGKMMAYSEDERGRIERLEARARNTLRDDAFTYRGRMAMKEPDGILSVPQIVNAQINRWKGWKCMAGVESIAIDDKGGIYNGWCKQEFYGTVFDDEIFLPSQPVLCRKERCLCNIDIMSTKFKGIEGSSEEVDFKGRFRESFKDGIRRWELGEGFGFREDLALEFRVNSKWLLPEVIDELKEMDITLVYEVDGIDATKTFPSRLLHMTGEVFRLGLGPDARGVLKSVSLSGIGEEILSCLKLNRISARHTKVDSMVPASIAG